MKLLIAGLGSVGLRHLCNLQSLGRHDIYLYRTGLGTMPEKGLTGFAADYDLETALARRPQATIIANPTSKHMSVALPAAEKGCHLFIEKPISHSLNDLEQLSATVIEKGLQVLVGFQFRFHPGLRIIKKLIDKDTIGRIVSAIAHWGEYLPAWHSWEDYRLSYSARADLGGGVLMTLCHPFDYLRWFLGDVQYVSAIAGQLSNLELDVEDSADVTLQFNCGAVGVVHLDYIQRPPTHRLQIIGESGSICWDNADGEVHYYQAGLGEWVTIRALEGFKRNSMFEDEMRHFLECINGQAVPLVTLDDGVRALEIALAAKRSAVEGKVIEVSSG